MCEQKVKISHERDSSKFAQLSPLESKTFPLTLCCSIFYGSFARQASDSKDQGGRGGELLTCKHLQYSRSAATSRGMESAAARPPCAAVSCASSTIPPRVGGINRLSSLFGPIHRASRSTIWCVPGHRIRLAAFVAGFSITHSALPQIWQKKWKSAVPARRKSVNPVREKPSYNHVGNPAQETLSSELRWP